MVHRKWRRYILTMNIDHFVKFILFLPSIFNRLLPLSHFYLQHNKPALQQTLKKRYGRERELLPLL